jgi:sugar phosphate isomerase/epimerase
MNQKRRVFLKNLGKITTAAGLLPVVPSILSSCSSTAETGKFEISLAEWSLNKSLFGGKLDNLDFPVKARRDFDIGGVEYVNQFFMDKAQDAAYLKELNQRASDHNVKNVLIMIDREGNLGDLDDAARKQAVDNHKKWVEAAKTLGCHSIRVNARGEGTEAEVMDAAVNGLGTLSEFAKDYGINVIVENHGGYSSDGDWISSVISKVNLPNCGTLPDFGNFCIERVVDPETNERKCLNEYDRYKGVKQMMPYAKGVSAKSHEFDQNGNEVHTDFKRMMQIVKEAGYSGYVGIEYEGSNLGEDEGIKATRDLLLRVFQEV